MSIATALWAPDKRQDWLVITLVGVGHAGSHFSHLLLPLMFPIFTEVFGLGYAQLGLCVTTFFVVSGIGQAMSGFLVDRVGAIWVLLCSLICLVLGCLVASFADGLSGLVAAAFLLGLGNCSFHPIDFSILNQKVSSQRIGYAYSAHGLCGNLGWAVAPVFMLTIAQTFGWRWSYLAAGLVFGLLLVLLWTYRTELVTPRSSHHDSNDVQGFEFMMHPTVWWCFAFFVFSTVTLSVVQSFGVSILQRMHEVSLWAANASLTGYMVCAAAGMLLGGIVSTRYASQSDRVVASCMFVGALLIALCASGWLGAMGSMLALASTGFAIGIGGPSRDLLIRGATPKGSTGRVYGLVYSGLDVGFAVAPVAFGLLMDRGLYAMTLLLAACTLLLSIGFALAVGHFSRLKANAVA